MLQVPVPQLEEFVRRRTHAHDAAFLSTDPRLVQAHVTALGPFVSEPTPTDLEVVGTIAAAVPAFDYVLGEVAAFPDGIVYLRPEPDDGFRALTRALVTAFLQCPPYARRFGTLEELVPHLTLDALATDDPETGGPITVESTRALLGVTLPARCRAERLDLVWWESGATRLLASWRLGPR